MKFVSITASEKQLAFDNAEMVLYSEIFTWKNLYVLNI
jgi:hypothetical protein